MDDNHQLKTPAEIRSQRWRDRRASFIGDQATLDPTQFAVDVISCTKAAKPFILQHHYSGSFPATRLSCGLFRNGARRSELVGVCSFAVPVNDASVPLQTGLCNPRSALDLGRLVLLDDVAGNAESWFVSRAFRLLRQTLADVEAVIAYSDPMPRHDASGAVILPGHVGVVYQALSAQFRGRSKARFDHTLPTGHILSARALSKIRAQDSGSAYAERQLTVAGAVPREPTETPAEWISRLEHIGFLARRRHPGNLVYAFALTQAAKIAQRGKPKLPYPEGVDTGRPHLTPLLPATD